MSLMISISGIRGVIGESLTPEVAVRYAAAFGAYCRAIDPVHPSVVVGRDGRITGSMVTDSIVSTLLATGVRVRLLDICPTPTVQLAVEREMATGGISVTASHNPMQWNGMKFVAPSGMFLDAAENKTLWALADQKPRYTDWQGIGTLMRDASWIDKHIDAVLNLRQIDATTIARRKFKVVLDCVNAAGGVIVPKLLKRLGCEVVELNCDVSGVFGHTPEPIPENLTSLATAVSHHKADLGIAVDPDVDRLVLITEKGEPFGEEYTITSAIKFVLSHRSEKTPATVVINLSTTRAAEDVAHAYNATCLRTPVGEINVVKKMAETGAVVGGEGSGGVILPAVHLGRDAIVGIGIILQQLAEFGGSLSEFKKTLPQYAIAKGKVALGPVAPDAALQRTADRHAARGRVNREDGVRIDFDDSWVHLRKSNTEPIARIIAEATTMDRARSLVEQFTQELQQ